MRLPIELPLTKKELLSFRWIDHGKNQKHVEVEAIIDVEARKPSMATRAARYQGVVTGPVLLCNNIGWPLVTGLGD